jgi:hypothetical protein
LFGRVNMVFLAKEFLGVLAENFQLFWDVLYTKA